MRKGDLFPDYVPRVEEERIRQEATRVRDDHQSRVVLLYGQSGVGKTQLVRELTQAGDADGSTIWLDPIDVDDSEYWLLSNLERKVAGQLDPANEYFRDYVEYLSRLPQFMQPRIGHETVLSHLGRIKQVFVRCYRRFVEGGENGKTVVITFDRIEAIRGMYLLLTVTQWMKTLPRTLFVVSGRPLPNDGDTDDPIKTVLEDPYQPLPTETVELCEFSKAAALDYLNASLVESALSDEEKQKLVHLTRGHPLWLAFTLDYLVTQGIPAEAMRSLAEIERDVPLNGSLTTKGLSLQEAFKRRLVTPYRDSDFWHEAIKRLAVLRRGVSQPLWRRLMSDLVLPDDAASWDDAWDRLLRTPWIRPRVTGRYVTLDDAVAEELALRIIPVHDQDEQWRRLLWHRVAQIYGELTEDPGAELDRQLDESLERVEREGQLTAEKQRAFIERVERLDAERRELDRLKAAHLYYQLLSDPEEGCRQFLALLEQASKQHDILFQQLIVTEMQRFLPNGVERHAFGEVVGGAISDFQGWLIRRNPTTYLHVGLSIAEHLINNEQPEAAVEQLDRLPAAAASPGQRYRLSILRGNACMRIRGRVKEAADYFGQALVQAGMESPPGGQKLIAEAYNEMGFYFRNVGLWQEADAAYQRAREAISKFLASGSPAEVREELASIQTNWAYIKGLRGDYFAAQNLVESAIVVRQRLGNRRAEGNSWSVRGEVYRYERQFQKAWDSYEEAERIFHGLRNSSWLGLIYQEQAICLFQAAQQGISLVEDPSEEAERRIGLALDICRDQAVRHYPSALNRAGRIFGHKDFRAGLRYLSDGINQARDLSDGWFWFANLIEYVELSYQIWADTGQSEYRDQIVRQMPEIEQVMSDYRFPDLDGRWNLLQGHLIIHDYLASRDDRGLRKALRYYQDGFRLISEGYVGSHGTAALASEFVRFRNLFLQLPADIRAAWQEELRGAWHGSISLLARLEELY
jgi:tetratricopeptide (TPR) repeat protein